MNNELRKYIVLDKIIVEYTSLRQEIKQPKSQEVTEVIWKVVS